MLKKLCVIFLSVCIAATMILGVNFSCSCSNIHDCVTLCDMSAGKVLC